MRTFTKWLEVYSKDNEYFRHYMKTDFDLQDTHFLSWSGLDDVLDRLNIDRDDLEDPDKYHDLVDRIEKSLSQREKDEIISHTLRHGSFDAPTWMHMHGNKRLPRQTWLIHFTDDADGIMRKGFSKGTEDMTRLGLTSYTKKFGPGYNFAFVASSRDARDVARASKYGKDAVMFQSSGIESYHHGDEESQVVFWGPSINKSHLIFLSKDDDGNWAVLSKDYDTVYKSDFSTVVRWVVNNYRQYYRKIMGALP